MVIIKYILFENDRNVNDFDDNKSTYIQKFLISIKML